MALQLPQKKCKSVNEEQAETTLTLAAAEVVSWGLKYWVFFAALLESDCCCYELDRQNAYLVRPLFVLRD